MSEPIELAKQFHRGMRRDDPRNDMRQGSLWNAVDVLPYIGPPLRERGGWANASNDIASTVGTASYVIAGLFARYEAGDKNLAIDEDGNLVSFASDGTVTNIGACLTPAQNPVIHRDKVVVTASGGATAPKKVTNAAGTLTIATLGGSPPNATYSTVYKDRTVLAYTSAEPQRVWFSAPGDPEDWDTTNAYWDFSLPITGIAAMRTAILVFHDGYLSRLRGTTPPPSSDFFSDDPLFAVGCTDARSIVTIGDRVIWANPQGIFITDGSAEPVNLAELCGMSTYWQDTVMAGYTSSTWTIVAGTLRNHYVVCVMDGTTLKDCAMIDLRRQAWWRLSNVDARSMWNQEGATDELFFGRRGAARVGKLSTIFNPTSTVKNDGDGDAVASVVELPFFEGRGGLKRWGELYPAYELTDYATDNPTVTVSYVLTPEETSYTNLSPALAENTYRKSRRLPVRKRGEGIGLKLARANAGDFLFYGVEADAHKLEPSRRAA